MTPVFCCGFECGQLGSAGQHWTSATGFSISTTTVRTDGRSLRCNPSAAAASSSCITNGNISGVTVKRFYLRFTTLPSADTFLAWMGAVNSANTLGLVFKQADSKLYAGRGSTIAFGATGVAVTTGVWYRIDLKIDQTSGTNLTKVDVQVDGTAVGQLVATNSGQNSNITVGADRAVSGDWFYDDWIHSNTSADYPIGAGHVDNFVPTSDGNHSATGTDFVKGTIATPVGATVNTSTTDAFNWVNAQPLLGGATDNTRLLNQQTAASTEWIEIIFGPGTGVSTPTVAPRAVEVITADREASTATCNFITKINDNATLADVINRGTVAGVITDRFATKQFATGPAGAWTVVSGAGNFNNLRARFGHSSDATPDVYWRGIMAEAEFADAVNVTTTQTVLGKARVTATTLKTQLGNANIRNTTNQTQLGKSRVQQIVSKSQQGISRVQKIVAATVSGIANIRNNTLRTQPGKARITASTLQTILGKALITITGTKTQQGKARVTASTLQTQLGKSRVTTTTTQNLQGRSRLQQSVTQTNVGRSRIQKAVSATLLGLARLQQAANKTINGLARITASSTKTQQGLARIRATVNRTITGVANIAAAGFSTANKTQLGKANIRATTTRTLAGVARLQAQTARTQQGISRVQRAVNVTVSGLARIGHVVAVTVPGRSRVTASVEQTLFGTANIRGTTIQTIAGRARIISAIPTATPPLDMNVNSGRTGIDVSTGITAINMGSGRTFIDINIGDPE